MRTGLLLSTVIAAMAPVSTVYGSIFANPITATNPSADNPFTTGQSFDPNVAVSGIGRGAGIGANSAADRYNANSWNTGAIDLTAYFTWTITPNGGFEIDFLNFVYTGQTSGTGPTNFAFRSSLDGFIADIGGPTATGTTISLGAAAFQNLTSSIEFRLYGWGASSSAGTFSVNDFTFDGEVAAAPVSVVPEATSCATWALLCGAVGLAVAGQKLRGQATA